MGKALMGQRSDEDWMLERATQQLDAGAATRTPMEHARQKRRPLEGLPVPPHGDFVAGTAGEVGPGIRIEALLGQTLVISEADDALRYLGELWSRFVQFAKPSVPRIIPAITPATRLKYNRTLPVKNCNLRTKFVKAEWMKGNVCVVLVA
jgi:hypothetical protein